MAAVTLPPTFTFPKPLPGLLRPGARPGTRSGPWSGGNGAQRPAFIPGAQRPAAQIPVAQVPVAPATYLRRQIVALALLLAVAVAVSVGVGAVWSAVTTAAPASAVAEPAGVAPVVVAPVAAGTPTHVVQPGETLWSIATEIQPEGDVRPLVDKLMERNGGSATLAAGQRLDLSGL